MLKQTKVLLWRAVAIFALLLGMIGVVLPILPTVPFILLAAWASSRGWPELERYLLSHAVYGEPIRNWRSRGVVSRRAKSFTTIMMSGSLILLLLAPLHLWVKLSVSLIMICVLIWLWSRPSV